MSIHAQKIAWGAAVRGGGERGEGLWLQLWVTPLFIVTIYRLAKKMYFQSSSPPPPHLQSSCTATDFVSILQSCEVDGVILAYGLSDY